MKSNCKIEHKELGDKITITLPNGVRVDIKYTDNGMYINSDCAFEGQQMVVLPRVSNEVYVTFVPEDTIKP